MSREWLGIALLFVQACINIPIIIRLYRGKNGRGISLAGEVIWIAGGLGWLLYGLVTGSLTLIISGSLAAVGCLLVSLLLVRYSRPPLKWSFLLGGFTFGGIILSYVVAGVPGLSVSLAIFGVAQFMPQLLLTLKALRERTPAEGVSISGSTFRAFYTAGWAFYAGAWLIWGIAFSAIDWPLFVWGLMGMVTFGLQALQAAIVRRTSVIA